MGGLGGAGALAGVRRTRCLGASDPRIDGDIQPLCLCQSDDPACLRRPLAGGEPSPPAPPTINPTWIDSTWRLCLGAAVAATKHTITAPHPRVPFSVLTSIDTMR